MAKVTINNGDLGSTARASINNNFTELYNYDTVVNASIGAINASLNSVTLLSTALTPDTCTLTIIRFDKIQGYVYGTRLVPIQYSFTMSASDAIVGVTNLIISASTGTPTFPITFKKLSGTYVTNTVTNDSSRNWIYVQYIDSSTQLYTINKIS